MLLSDFTGIIKELSDYYERAKEPKQGSIELWFEKIKWIPSEPVKFIIKKIEENNESFPRNLPLSISSAYSEWKDANSDKAAHKSYFDCPDCSEGLIFAKKEIEGKRYSYVFRCSRCRQNDNRNYPMSSRLELLQNYTIY